MTEQGSRNIQPSIRDEAVQAKTGKNWSEWLAVLDQAGAAKMNHKEIVAYLVEHYQVADWWQQMVAVTYEQARGLRDRHENLQGYQVSASKTIQASLERLFAAWEDEKQRAAWLPDPEFQLRKATPGKSLRITWVDGKTNVDVGFSPKGAGRSMVAVQHSKLPDAESVARQKEYWVKALERLETYLKER
jgi:uncharacterized protein YndB with AHSA1/START domain